MKIAGGFAVGVVIVVGLFWLIGIDFFRTDRCLDAGGRWEESTKSCDFGD